MKLDDLTGKTGEWLRGESSMSDVVISSRVRLARNIAGYPFLSTASDSERAEVYRLLADEISAVVGDVDALLVDMDEADDLERQLLVERHLISRQRVLFEANISQKEGITFGTARIFLSQYYHKRLSC